MELAELKYLCIYTPYYFAAQLNRAYMGRFSVPLQVSILKELSQESSYIEKRHLSLTFDLTQS